MTTPRRRHTPLTRYPTSVHVRLTAAAATALDAVCLSTRRSPSEVLRALVAHIDDLDLRTELAPQLLEPRAGAGDD